MARLNVIGTFKQRGTESIDNVPTITEFAQNNELTSAIRIGSAGRNWVSVVTYNDEEGNVKQQMVKHGMYELIDFRSDFDYNAYNNMSDRVRRYLGAYSSAYKVGAGFE